MNDQAKAAMQMALDLEKADERDGYYSYDIEITALREALAQPQGEWVDLTVDEIAKALNTADSHNTIDSYRSVIAKFKEKNTPPVVQQGEPVYAFRRKGLDDFCTCDERRYLELSDKPNLFETTIFYTTPPSVEAAIEATKKQFPNLDPVINWLEDGCDPREAAQELRIYAAAIRGMK